MILRIILMKYSRELGGLDSAEDKGLIAQEDMVKDKT